MSSLLEKDGFYGAARARQIAMGQASGTNTLLGEINSLQVAVDTAAAGGTLEATVSGTTTMTSSEDYFNSWNDPFNNDTAADKLRRAEMQEVINYFTRLGYHILRVRNGVTDFFDWKITW